MNQDETFRCEICFGGMILMVEEIPLIHQLSLVVSPIIYQGFELTSKRWLALGFLNHQLSCYYVFQGNRIAGFRPGYQDGSLKKVSDSPSPT